MAKASKQTVIRESIREQRRKKERQSKMIKWGILAAIGLAVLGFLIYQGTRPVTAAEGEVVQVGRYDHVPEGSNTGPYPTDPPAGGLHYALDYEPGFYNEADIVNLPKNYEGYLVHNLEHGYVIFWYNCAADPNFDCEGMKQTVRKIMDTAGTHELIAFPWPSQKEPLVLTSWGRILRLDRADENLMREFIRLNLNKSPEPLMP